MSHHRYSHKSGLFHLFILSFLILGIPTILFAEKKSKLYYSGYITDLKDSTVVVPEECVSLSENFLAESFWEKYLTFTGTPSIFIIIDHSQRMYDSITGNPETPYDKWGERFRLAYNLIDTLFHYIDSAEVGLAVFRQYLYFDPSDDNRFVQCPGQDTGAYLPLLKLDSSYAPDGKFGYQILKEYLETDTVSEGNLTYTDLSYRPSNYNLNEPVANINVAIDAAKHAFPSAMFPKYRQFIFFITGGDATYPTDGTANEYVEKVKTNTPTTFTLFLNPDTIPSNYLMDMTDNIKKNNYSKSNLISEILPFNESEYFISNFVFSLMMSYYIKTIIIQPTQLTINGKTTTDVNYFDQFYFDIPFPYPGKTTNFNYEIEYIGTYDSIVFDSNGFPIDTIIAQSEYPSLNGSFTITIVEGAELPDSSHYPGLLSSYCWYRNLEFYHNAKPVTVADGSMKDLEIRFTHDSLDIDYDYKNVSVEITQSNGPVNDKETFTLTDFDSLFSRSFPIAIDSTPAPDDGILQLHEKDSIIAVFRNSDIPILPLDTIRYAIGFNTSSSIDPHSQTINKQFHYVISHSGSGNYSIRLFNVPSKGTISLFTLNGRELSHFQINRGNSVVTLPGNIATSVYIMRLEYKNQIVQRKLLLH